MAIVKSLYELPVGLGAIDDSQEPLEINIEKIEPDEEMEELYDYKDYLEKT